MSVLAARVAEVPQAIGELIARGLPSPSISLSNRRWNVTAAGVSEGPAHLLVELLGRSARFVPLSVIATAPPVAPDVLVVFSQGLSPNARIALNTASNYRDVILFTSAPPPPGPCVIELPPREPEDGMLLRVLGPAVARAAAVLFANQVAAAEGLAPTALEGVEAAVTEAMARARGSSVTDRVVFVAHGDDVGWARALAWKWMEGLWVAEPPTWDVLQFAHGPLQSLYGEPCTVITLEREGAPSGALFERLGAVLVPERHRWIRLRSRLPGPLAALEHDAGVNVLLVDALDRNPRDLAAWPGKGQDAALYALDERLTCVRNR